ncbi:hypothetical protein ISCGN_022503 [Ixodes scapularis]
MLRINAKILQNTPFIRNIYGSVALSNVREYLNLSTTIVRLECHQDFNRQCIQRGLIPQGLRCKPLVDTPYGRKLARDFSLNCVKARVQDNKQRINHAKKRQATAERNLRHVLQYDDLRSIFVARKQAEDMEKKKQSELHNKKLARLMPPEPTSQNEKRTVFNYSSKELTDHHCNLRFKHLCLGGGSCLHRVDYLFGDGCLHQTESTSYGPAPRALGSSAIVSLGVWAPRRRSLLCARVSADVSPLGAWEPRRRSMVLVPDGSRDPPPPRSRDLPDDVIGIRIVIAIITDDIRDDDDDDADAGDVIIDVTGDVISDDDDDDADAGEVISDVIGVRIVIVTDDVNSDVKNDGIFT